ncbi:serine hydrolase-like protein [Rhypophila decipiens]
MSRLFRHKSVSARMQLSSTTTPADNNPESGYSSLLESNVSPQSSPQHRRSKSSTSPWGYGFTIHQNGSRSWLGTAENRSSWNGGGEQQRQPTRKLVKEQNGSGRPSFSLELSDNSDGENKGKGVVRRQLDRFRHHLSRLLHTTGSFIIMLSVLGISAGLLVGVGAVLENTRRPKKRKTVIKAPKSRLSLPTTSETDAAEEQFLLPGGRDVETPYGSIRVFEWGPEDGEKVLLMHGISTPCLSLANLGVELASMGYRVMTFDFFGRGYSDAPIDLPYDLRLYSTQILLVLASSGLAWTGNEAFHLVGYSLGGGVAVSFARYYPHMIRSLVLIAGGGLIRKEHVNATSKVLYSSGIFPDSLLEFLVRRRVTPPDDGGTNEAKMAGEVVDVATTRQAVPKGKKKHGSSDASGGDSYDNAVLRPGLTVSTVMRWQLRHHRGFVSAFMSSIRHAPIYEQTEDWRALGELLEVRRRNLEGGDGLNLPGLQAGRVLMVLGATDPVIVKEELIHDATAVLGEDGFEAVLLDCGHEIVMTKGKEIAHIAAGFWSAP